MGDPVIGPRALVATVVVVAALGTVAAPSILDAGAAAKDPKTVTDVTVVEPHPNSSERLWPYTSRQKRFESLTLPINLVFRTDAGTTRYVLTQQTNRDWENQTERYENASNVSIFSGESPASPTPSGANDTNDSNETNETVTATRTSGITTFYGWTARTQPDGSNETNDTTTTETNESTANGTNRRNGTTPTEAGTPTPTNETGDNVQNDPVVIVNGTSVGWEDTDGGTRYTYIVTEDGGRWKTADYQLHDGDYFGRRIHLRLYEGGTRDNQWTAVQAHTEYWDWFGLHHQVGSVSKAKRELERSFFGEWYVTSISRERFANGGVLDADGWVSTLDFRDNVIVPPRLFLLPITLGLVALTTRELPLDARRLRRRVESIPIGLPHVALFAVIAAIPLVARAGALAVERAYPSLSPILVGAPFYLLQVVGLPVAAAVLARWLNRQDAFSLALAGFGVGVFADYAYLGITTLQFGVVMHRLAAAFVLGVIAAGSAGAADTRNRGLLVAGLLAWLAVVVGPLL